MPTQVFLRYVPAVSDACAQAWLDDALALALVFTNDVHGTEPVDRTIDLAMVYQAALAIWERSGGEPAWSVLRLDDLLHGSMAASLGEDVRDALAMTAQAFVCFLFRRGHLASARASALSRQLAPHTQAALQRLFTMESTLSAAFADQADAN